MAQDEKAASLKNLLEKIRTDPKYRNERMGDVLVPGRGSLENVHVVLIGEAPGREEERQGSPFVGPAGKNLNIVLQRVGLSRDEIFVTNLLKYRPITLNGRNRSPTIREGRRALPYLLEELHILSPRLVVCLGLSSAKILLQEQELRMSKASGTFFEKHGFKILVTYHPSPFNFSISRKKEALFQAFQQVREAVSA